MTKATDLRAKNAEALKQDAVLLKKESFNLRFQKASNTLTNTSRVRAVRRELARINTILREKAQA
jgi:large subunit ribosomal protein L29